VKDLEARIASLQRRLDATEAAKQLAEDRASDAASAGRQVALLLDQANIRIIELSRLVAEMRREGFAPPPEPVRMEDEPELPQLIQQTLDGLPLDRATLAQVRARVHELAADGKSVEEITEEILAGEPLEG